GCRELSRSQNVLESFFISFPAFDHVSVKRYWLPVYTNHLQSRPSIVIHVEIKLLYIRSIARPDRYFPTFTLCITFIFKFGRRKFYAAIGRIDWRRISTTE